MQPIIDSWLQYPADKVSPVSEVLTRKLNYYNAVLVERAVQYHEALARMNANPSQIIQTNEGPKTIEVIVEIRRASMLEIVSTVETAQAMHKAAEAGNVATYWTGDALSIPTWSPERVEALKERDEEANKQ